MRPFLLFLILRIGAAGFFMLTAVFAAVCYSPFAFDMFVRPQLFPWLNQFVQWHHLWYWAAYFAAVASLSPALSRGKAELLTAAAAYWLTVLYVIAGAAIGVWLIESPLLPKLGSDNRSLTVAILACIPWLWMASIDHLIAVSDTRSRLGERGATTPQRRLLATAIGTALLLWAAHLLRALIRPGVAFTPEALIPQSTWTLLLVLTVFIGVYSVLGLLSCIAAATRAPRTWEFVLALGLLATVISEFVRRVALPTLSLNGLPAAAIASTLAITLSITVSGITLRRPGAADSETGLDLLLAPRLRPGAAALLLIVLTLVSFAALSRIERLDWDFLLQKTVVGIEWTCAFALMLRLSRRIEHERWSIALAFGPAMVVCTVISALPSPEPVLDRGVAAELGFRMTSGAVVRRAGFDPDYFRFLQLNTEAKPSSATMPDIDLAVTALKPIAQPPDVFLFVVDSLRRDYLGVYNPAVSFTPNIDRFAADSFVFRNSFTRYGATRLSMPSIWSGGPMLRQIDTRLFARMNSLEKFVNGAGYRIAINDFTVRPYLQPSTPITDLDPTVLSINTDLCQNLQSLQQDLAQSSEDRRPVLTYLAPMNVHILNTHDNGQTTLDHDYPGFYSPYASRLGRIDACFGRFIDFLKQRGSYDNSIMILTSDHGDSLGEQGNWGHAVWMFPEDIRVPLIVHVPAAAKPAMTTDVARIAFTNDITPTIYTLAGQTVRDLGPLFGSPLFVPMDQALVPRRRESYLLMSSYGGAYALLRRNGRFLYVSDFLERHEFGFDLSKELIGEPVPVTDDERRMNQRLIRSRITAVNRVFQFQP